MKPYLRTFQSTCVASPLVSRNFAAKRKLRPQISVQSFGFDRSKAGPVPDANSLTEWVMTLHHGLFECRSFPSDCCSYKIRRHKRSWVTSSGYSQAYMLTWYTMTWASTDTHLAICCIIIRNVKVRTNKTFCEEFNEYYQKDTTRRMPTIYSYSVLKKN